MKTIFYACRAWLVFGAALLASPLLLADKRVPGVNVAGTNEDFSAIKLAVVALLQSGDAGSFADAILVRADDWKAIYSTNNTVHDPDSLAGFERDIDRERNVVKNSAVALLEMAAKLHLDFSKATLRARVVAPTWLGSIHYPTLQETDDESRYAEKIDIIFNLGDGANPDGNFDIAARGMIKFPGGWRCQEGVQWVSFPTNVVDEKTAREISLMSKVAERKSITDTDDPSLRNLGQSLVHFLQTKDMSVFRTDVFVKEDPLWSQIKNEPGDHPSRKDLDDYWGKQFNDATNAARDTLRFLESAGITFDGAAVELGKVSIDQPQSPGNGSLLGFGFAAELKVRSDANSKTGQNISGTYILAGGQAAKYGDDWRIVDKLRWSSLPKGVLDTNAEASLELENFIGKEGALPPGIRAPDIAFTSLDGERAMKLSDLRGKVVLLDFWATWCGPCQAPMAQLQTIRSGHSNWGDDVVIVPISIDDTMAIVRDHIMKRGWTNTLNVWAGDGGWFSKTAKTFRVNHVPTTYVIDQRGKIAWQGYADEKTLQMTVENLLKNPARN